LVFREQRDAAIEKLRLKYAPKLASLQEKVRKAEQAHRREAEEASTSKWTSALQVGASLLGAILGRKAISATNAGRVATASRSVGRTMKQSSDVTRAEETLEKYQADLAMLDEAFRSEVESATTKFQESTVTLEPFVIRPRKMDVKPRLIALAWLPYWRDADGQTTPAWS
jgi:hypothetical protein